MFKNQKSTVSITKNSSFCLMINSKPRYIYRLSNLVNYENKGFTIVELLVVIVVIGILASIVVISYMGITEKAVAVSLQSDLSNASKQLKLYQVVNGLYPGANECPNPNPANICLKSSSGNSYTYSVNNVSNPPTFELTATNDNGMSYMITDSTPAVAVNAPSVSIPTIDDSAIGWIGEDGAILGANITSDGGSPITDMGTCWGTSPNPTTNCESALNGLSQLSHPVVPAGLEPIDIATSSDGLSTYIVNVDSDTISLYSRNVITGDLSPLDSPTIATERGPSSIVISPEGNSVYVTNGNSASVSMYSRNTSTGVLTPLASPTVATGTYPKGIVISPDGMSVYVSNNSSYTISMYSRNTSTGVLTPLASPTIAAGSGLNDIAISADGLSVYVTNGYLDSVYTYSRNTSTGNLTRLVSSTMTTGDSPEDIVVSSDGKFVYVANLFGYSISMYSRNTTTGALTPFASPTMKVGSSPMGNIPISIYIPQDGISFYVLISGDSSPVLRYSRNEITGELTYVDSLYVGMASYPKSVYVSPDNLSLHILGIVPNTVSVFSRSNVDGSLTPPVLSNLATGEEPFGVAVSNDGKSVYVVNNVDRTVSMYSRNVSTGILTALSTPTVPTAAGPAGGPFSIAISGDDKSVYVTNWFTEASDSVSMYSRNISTGELTPLASPTIAVESRPSDIVVSNDGLSVYVTNYDSDSVSMYSRNVTTGALTPLISPTIATGENPTSMTISDDDMFVYVTNSIFEAYGTISVYSRNPTTGALSALALPVVNTRYNPSDIIISRDGLSVYVANSHVGSISMYSRDEITGALTPLSTPSISIPDGPFNLIISNDGYYVYSLNYDSGAISVFLRDISTGALVRATEISDTWTEGIPNGITMSKDGSSIYVTNSNWDSGLISAYSINKGAGVFSHSRYDMLPETTIYFRAYATNSEGTVYSKDLVFVTKKQIG